MKPCNLFSPGPVFLSFVKEWRLFSFQSLDEMKVTNNIFKGRSEGSAALKYLYHRQIDSWPINHPISQWKLHQTAFECQSYTTSKHTSEHDMEMKWSAETYTSPSMWNYRWWLYFLQLRLIKISFSNGRAVHYLPGCKTQENRGNSRSNRPWLLSPPFFSAALKEKVLSSSHHGFISIAIQGKKTKDWPCDNVNMFLATTEKGHWRVIARRTDGAVALLRKKRQCCLFVYAGRSWR